jgi:hypothetical protein
MEMYKNAHILQNRFGLRDAQFFARYIYKNLWWEVDGKFFGFGDITSADVFRIQNRLDNGEIFQGWNEHHGTDWQQTNVPMIRIEKGNIMMHVDLVAEEKERGELG